MKTKPLGLVLMFLLYCVYLVAGIVLIITAIYYLVSKFIPNGGTCNPAEVHTAWQSDSGNCPVRE